MDVDTNTTPPEPAPTELSTTNVGHGLEVQKDKLTVKYTADGRHTNDVGSIQANFPIPTRCAVYYYEVTVLDHGEHGKIAVGFADKNFKLTRQPGWESNSYAYHGDDGRKYLGNGKGEEYGPCFSTGDTIGAGIHMGRQELFFTKNGAKLKAAYRPVKGGLIPTIGLHSKGEMVRVNFGQAPFIFDLAGMLAEEKAAQQAAVDKVPMPAGMTHQVVRKYLLHYGYAETLAAFDAAAGMSELDENSMVCEDQATALQLRQSLRRCVLAGRVDDAVSQLQQHYPQLLDKNSEVMFHLSCQKYIELVRTGLVEEAVAFAQSTLGKLRNGATTQLEALLRDVVALIAYQQPETSPLAYLLGNAQREMVADTVNAAVLAAAGAAAGSGQSTSGSGGSSGVAPQRPVSCLEQLLQQLVTVQAVSLELNGGQGEIFRLRDWLLPAAGGQG